MACQIGNISRSADPKKVAESIAHSLAPTTLRALLKTSAGSVTHPPSFDRDSPLRRFFVRLVPTHGTLVLHFHDVRYALAAKLLFATRFTDELDFCLDNQADAPYPAWFTSAFLTDVEVSEVSATASNSALV